MFKKIALLALVACASCTCGRIDPGHVGVVVPLSGTEKGHLELAPVGWYVYSFTTHVYEFPTFNQQHIWTASISEGKLNTNERIYFMDRNGLQLGADVGVQFHVPPGEVLKLFTTYRQDLDHIRDTVLKMSVRNAMNVVAQKYTAEDIFGDKRSEFFLRVQETVKSDMSPNGLEVVNLYLNGQLELPQQIAATIQAKLQATMTAQQKENEKRSVEAEAAKQVAAAEGQARAVKAQAEGEAAAAVAQARGAATAKIARAEAEARSNELLAASLTPAIIEWTKMNRTMDIEFKKAEKWQGNVPGTILPAQANSPFIYDIRK